MAIFDIPEELTDTPVNGAIVYFADKSQVELKFNPPLCWDWERRKFNRWPISKTRKIGVEIRADSEVIKLSQKENWVELKNGERIGYSW
jgi:flavin-dependent dehydrogenase